MTQPVTQPKVIGLTGNIATGKSTVLAYLAAKGAHVVDADKLAHRAMQPDGPAFPLILAEFGDDILAADGTIDRPALGRVVFADPSALARLEAILHPQVYELAKQEIASTSAPVVILEAIKLLESGWTIRLCDQVWVITSPMDAQLQRLADTRNMPADEANRRLAAQSAQEAKMAQADHIIRNDGSLADLYTQLDALWQQLADNR